MLIKKLTDEELEFMESWHSPKCLVETLFHDFDNLSSFSEDEFGDLRLYQIPFLSHEPIIDSNMPDLSEKQRFNLRKGAGDVIALGARKFGKSLICEKLDIPLSLLHDDSWWCGFSSYDAMHIDSILDVVKEAIENHPIVRNWKRSAKKSPKWKIVGKNGWKLEGINMNILSKNPGHQFYGLHVKKLWIEEQSFESQKVMDKRQDSLSELGAVLRFSGMTNFTRHSPSGKAFYDPKNKNKVINLPQYVNPFYDKADDIERLKEFNGSDSIGYKVFVKGEVVEDGVSEFDMERVKECYNEKKEIKAFEITKESFSRFKNLIVTERPKNADRMFICSDIGESAPSELIILSEVKDKYNYLYNITLRNLTHLQQAEIFKWLVEKVEANIVGIDCGDGTGRAVFRELEKTYKSKENLVWYDGSMKIPVDFDRDEKGNLIMLKGVPQYKYEKMSEWSVRRLKSLLYEVKMRIPIDYKFDSQFNQVISIPSGNSRIYKCVVENDHLFDAFRVFSIAQWLTAGLLKTPKIQGTWGLGI